MPDIMVVFGCVSQCLDATTLRQLCCVSEALLSMTGRVTMRGISRWTNKGGSYRTLQRFFSTRMSWLTLQWVLMRQHLLDPGDTIFAAGDHVVVTKSGKKTYGLDRFFSSLSGQAVPGLCFLRFSLISVKHRTSYPALIEQVAKAPVAQKLPQKQSSRPRGRPKGSKNRHRRDVDFSPSLRFIQAHLARLLPQIGDHLKVVYFLFDGELGHNEAMQMVRQVGLHVVSKPHGARHRCKPPASWTRYALEGCQHTLTPPLHAFPKRRTGRRIVLALEPRAQVLDPVKHGTQRRNASTPVGPRDQRVHCKLSGSLQPTCAKLCARFGLLWREVFLPRSPHRIECPDGVLDPMEAVQHLTLIAKDLGHRRIKGREHLHAHPLHATAFRVRAALQPRHHVLNPSPLHRRERSTVVRVHDDRVPAMSLAPGVCIKPSSAAQLAGVSAPAPCQGPTKHRAR
jgi:hypothetical protein